MDLKKSRFLGSKFLMLILTGLGLSLASPTPSLALLSFGSNCDIGALGICWSYSWYGVCNDGTAVGGDSFWASDIGTDITNACSSHGGFVVASNCTYPAVLLESGVCALRIAIPIYSLTEQERERSGLPPAPKPVITSPVVREGEAKVEK